MDLFLRGPEPPPEMESSMLRRHAKPLLVAAAVLAALLLTISRRGDAPAIVFGPSPLGAAPERYDLGQLRVFNLSLHRVKENYVDPTRLDPRKMLLAALDYVQRGVAEVMVDARDDGGAITVRVDDARADFDLRGVDSPWALSNKLKEVMKFLQAHVHKSTDVRDIEYDAVNGMLSTLDPHSQLLKPDVAKEMDLQTRGEFGGLGIVIGIRKGQLTIIKPIEAPPTPASRAGLQRNDRIGKINEESTVNMTLTEAVSRLRGAPGTKVTIWIERAGAPARRLVLVRDMITIESVKSKLLKGGVGYVSIENFQGNTCDALDKALKGLRHQGARAFVLDLRGNPGGLLDQAVKVADVFVAHGTLVTTVGMGGRQREDKRAEPDADEMERLPVAALVNEGSASASEIVAGALRQLDRAVVIGRQTFGKGTVQVLYDNDDGSKLKLTIAQYLTPGDVSIQQVGVTPDIVLRPVWIAKDTPPRFYASGRRTMRETDLEEGEPLAQQGVRSTDEPLMTVYYLEDPPKWWGVEEEGDDPEETEEPEQDKEPGDDPETRFARDLIVQGAGVPQPGGGRGEARPGRRSEILQSSAPFLARRIAEESAKIEAALAKTDVDWAAAPAGTAAPQLLASATASPARVEGGQTATLELRVRNNGPAPAFRVRAVTKSPDPVFDEREMFVGKLKPGQERVVTLPVRVPRNSVARVDPIKVEIAADGFAGAVAETHVETAGAPRPLFAYGYQVIDDVVDERGAPLGNRDGLVQKGERVRLRVDVRDVGPGKALKVWTTLKNRSGPGIFIHKGRFMLGDLTPAPLGASEPVAVRDAAAAAPPAVRSADFDFEVKSEFEEDEFTLELSVYDAILHDYVSEKLKFRLAPPGAPLQAASGVVRLPQDGVEARAGADATSAVIGRVWGAALVSGRVGPWARLDLGARPGFVAVAAATPTTDPPEFRFAPELQVTPPVLALEPAPRRQTGAGAFDLRGTATDDRKVADLYVVVSNREAKIDAKKVFYRSNTGAKDPRRLAFAARVPLWPGQNHVTVVARENDDVLSRETLILTREGTGTTAQVAK